MLIHFIRDFEAKTATGCRLIAAGTFLDLAEAKAAALIAAEVAEPADLPRPHLDQAGGLVIPIDAPARFRWWQGGQPPSETLRELFEERAAIMEFDGGLSRPEAESRAAEITGYQPNNERSKSDEKQRDTPDPDPARAMRLPGRTT